MEEFRSAVDMINNPPEVEEDFSPSRFGESPHDWETYDTEEQKHLARSYILYDQIVHENMGMSPEQWNELTDEQRQAARARFKERIDAEQERRGSPPLNLES